MRWAWRGLALLALASVGAFLLLRVPDSDRAAMRAKYGAPPSRFVTLPGGPAVHYRDEGPRDALAIVLLHGSNADLHTWQPWVDRLKARHRILRFDQRGHGLTGPAPDGDYSPAAFAADLDALTRKLEVERFVLAGNSMGGGIAARYAMTHPERLAGLVLIDAAGAPVERTGGGNLAFTLARVPGVAQAFSAILPRSLIERSLRQSVSNRAVVTPAAVDRYWELARYPGNRAATLARFGQSAKPFTLEEMRRITVPTLILWGAEDQLIPAAAARWFAGAIPGARAIIYPGIGHLPMEEAADRSAADLEAFVTAAAQVRIGG
ncbi:alpha/beta fold hydrolase [Qipengyuania sediminis]|uniref:alpha/beta fold hydrolase n=1 Tax=Qipengyuania sediminis TaxID=1532023 RepID=UPI0010593666|nr:alpha/beta hydrolase [Qipengyuania sediminis]